MQRQYHYAIISLFSKWRKGGDLNPREACTPDGFRDRSIRPLWHPSVLEGYRRMSTTVIPMLKYLMVKYRLSRFHNAKNGRRLAKLMAIAVSLTRNPIRTKTIDGITYELDLREVIDSSLYFTLTSLLVTPAMS